jgi:hypothetical protein
LWLSAFFDPLAAMFKVYKMEHLSQSAKAMRKFLDYFADNTGSSLWPGGYK